MSRARRLAVVTLLNLALMAALAGTGAAAHSLAVFAAGADYLADAAAIGMSLLLARSGHRRPGRTPPHAPY